jgi:ATPase subunit of ABC transporter with duplicated ATPase domains
VVKSMSLIDLDGISFRYPNGNQVLEGLSLRLEEDDKIGLLGENGTGKTTLFHIIHIREKAQNRTGLQKNPSRDWLALPGL